MRSKKIIWIIVALVFGTGVFWWTTIKKKVLRKAVTGVVQKKTDSLYRITYDTAEIDEVGGNAYFYNVQVKIDSAQWIKLVEKDSMPPVTMAVTIAKISIKGLSELKLLSNHSLDVNSITLEKPVFRLDKWARKKMPAEGLNDTLEIYKRLVGNFEFLRAKNIDVVEGSFTMVDQLRNQVFAADGINIGIDGFLVDSAHNYRNIFSYFIRQTRATVRSLTGTKIKTGKVVYDSKQHLLRVDSLLTTVGDRISVRSIAVEGLSTESFISLGQVNARKVLVTEPDITLRPSEKKGMALPAMITSGSVDSFMIRKANATIHTKKGKPLLINDADLLLRNIKIVNAEIPVETYLSQAGSIFSIGSMQLPMGLHSMRLKKISYPNDGNQLVIEKLQVKPVITRRELKTKIGKQSDLFNITASNIILAKINLQELIKHNTVLVDKLSLQIDLHVFDDKTLKVDSVKRGKGIFPYEALQAAKTKISIRTVEIKNSRIAYEEQAPKSGLNGTVFFTGVTGEVTNITNIPALLAKDNAMKVNVTAKLMGTALIKSQWYLPLNTTDGHFKVSGSVSPFALTILSPAFEPLSMASIRSGFADKLSFEINGDHEGSNGNVLLNYHDLKVDLLKKNKEDSLEKKGLLSALANADIRNKNTSDKPKQYTFKKDRYKSFFNLLWKSVFEGGKKNILIVH